MSARRVIGGTPRHVGDVATFALTFSGLCAFFYSGYLWNLYFEVLPRRPAALVGRIHPVDMHGVIAFATQAELARMHWFGAVGFILLVIGVGVGWWRDGAEVASRARRCPSRYRAAIKAVALGGILASFIAFWFFPSAEIRSLPRSPASQIGRVHAVLIDGEQVFATTSEQDWIWAMERLPYFVFCLSTGALGLTSRVI